MSDMKLNIFLPLIGAFLLATSCMKSENTDDLELSNHCAITNVVIGTLHRVVQTKRVTGEDTSYVTSLYGGYYPMYIDQLNREIYNTDSLPVGTNVKAVVFSSITSDGVLTYRTESGNDTIFNASDSLDFTNPRIFTCYPYSGVGKKSYRIHVNVHKVDPQAFTWNQVPSEPSLPNMEVKKSMVRDGELYVFAVSGTERYAFKRTTYSSGGWERQALTGQVPDELSGISLFKQTFYGVSQYKVVTSKDGVEWTEISDQSSLGLKFICGSTDDALYAIGNEGFYASPNGLLWTRDAQEPVLDDLPNNHLSSVVMSMSFNEAFQYILISGYNQNAETVLWKKLVDASGDNNDVWSRYSGIDGTPYGLPHLPSPSMISYDERLLYLGCKDDTLSLFYVSEDAGRNWRPNANVYVHPRGIPATSVSAAVDDEHYVWIVCGGSGEVWRGRLNQLAFEKQQTAYTK